MDIAVIALVLALAASPLPAARDTTLLKDWTLSRCIGRAAGPPFRDDAYKSAAALLEKSGAGIDTFNRLDRLIDNALAQQRGGSVPGRYDTLKCLDLYHSDTLARAVAGRSRRGR